MLESLTGYWRTFLAHLAIDRRKTAALALLTLVLVVVWGRAFLTSNESVIAQAPAELASSILAPQPAEAVASAVTVAAMTVEPGTPDVVDLRPVSIVLARDFFAGEYDSASSSTRPAESSEVGILERIRMALREKRQERQRRCAQIEAEASKLVLQSTLVGAQELAVVSGRKLVIGDVVDGFRLVSVRDRSAVLEKDGHRVTLSMP